MDHRKLVAPMGVALAQRHHVHIATRSVEHALSAVMRGPRRVIRWGRVAHGRHHADYLARYL